MIKMAPTLRARHGKIVPVNVCSLDNRKAIGKMNENAIVMTRKKRLRISDDSLLDMFCFFKRRELCSFELVNRRMKRVVELGDQKKQLRQRIILDEIHFSTQTTCYGRIPKPAVTNLNTMMIHLDGKNDNDINKRQPNQILVKDRPLILAEYHNHLRLFPNFYLNIFPTANHNTVLELKLPTRPTTLEDLHLIRFWFRKLSQTHFSLGILNPIFMSNLFPNEETNFLSFGQLTIQPASYDSMLPGVTALAQSHTLICKLLIHPNCDIKTLFSMLILASRHVITKMFIRVFEEVSISDLIKFFDELDFSKLKRLPTTIQFYSDQNFLPDHFMDSPQLMRLQTTNAKTEKYELRHEGRFGSLKIFFGICSQWPNYLTVRIVD